MIYQFSIFVLASDINIDISKYLTTILDRLNIIYSDEGISIIAQKADGSMRDALSLLDQVIAYNEDELSLEMIQDVLGIIKENIYSLDQLKDLLPFSKEDIYQDKVNENEIDDVTELNEKIAKLKLEIKNEKNYSEMFDTLVTDLISLRNSLRDDKKFDESDNIINLLEKLDIVIEDDKKSSSWSFKDL